MQIHSITKTAKVNHKNNQLKLKGVALILPKTCAFPTSFKKESVQYFLYCVISSVQLRVIEFSS